jgi:murE/murF fusion protein
VLVLGDMGEVGDNGPEMHHEVGAYAKQKGIEVLLTLGQATRESARAFGDQAMAFDELEALQAELEKIDAQSLLIKGSRFMRMERVVRGCLARFGIVPGELVAHAV